MNKKERARIPIADGNSKPQDLRKNKSKSKGANTKQDTGIKVTVEPVHSDEMIPIDFQISHSRPVKKNQTITESMKPIMLMTDSTQQQLHAKSNVGHDKPKNMTMGNILSDQNSREKNSDASTARTGSGYKQCKKEIKVKSLASEATVTYSNEPNYRISENDSRLYLQQTVNTSMYAELKNARYVNSPRDTALIDEFTIQQQNDGLGMQGLPPPPPIITGERTSGYEVISMGNPADSVYFQDLGQQQYLVEQEINQARINKALQHPNQTSIDMLGDGDTNSSVVTEHYHTNLMSTISMDRDGNAMEKGLRGLVTQDLGNDTQGLMPDDKMQSQSQKPYALMSHSNSLNRNEVYMFSTANRDNLLALKQQQEQMYMGAMHGASMLGEAQHVNDLQQSQGLQTAKIEADLDFYEQSQRNFENVHIITPMKGKKRPLEIDDYDESSTSGG